jgi:hypothetical protein
MIKSILLRPEEAVQHWSELTPMIESALNHGQNETTLMEYLKRVLEYRAQIWVFFKDNELKGCGLTQFIEYGTHKTLHIVACSGVDWSSWAEGYYQVEEFARMNNCKRVEMWGREGWLRRLPKLLPGWEQAYVVMSKEIEPKESSDENKK